ncbi:hypothetical protein [Alteribacter populi]|uniref:hypothetical protein n=1 Tax=Alteribacter populi TaxID=2011011 RepID=UPI000BBA5735|nr:hypothetical protein [Alteribacter populi]
MPADTSVASILKGWHQHFLAPLTMGASAKKKDAFAASEGRRLAFSLDFSWPLTPTFKEQPVPEKYELVTWGKKNMAYGYHSLEGAAPILQPIYMQYAPLPVKQSQEDNFGKWTIKDVDPI